MARALSDQVPVDQGHDAHPTRTMSTAQRNASHLVQVDCKFLIGDRVHDECFGPGAVIELPLESYPAGDHRRGKIFIQYDDATLEPRWRTWGHFVVPERRAQACAAVTRNGKARQQVQFRDYFWDYWDY